MTHASLFSGIGGPEIAAAMLGWENLFHCEINPFGRKVLDYWFPKSKSYEDITKTDFSEWRGKVDVLTGGFPCQPFSYAGQRRGADDDRYLWPYMFKAIDAIRPAWVVAENVAGITTMVEQGEVVEMGGQASLFEEVDDIHRYRLVETFTLQRICDDLEGHGYAVQPVLVPACAVGAPHRRDRVFIIGRQTTALSDTAGDGRDGYPCKDMEERYNNGETKRICETITNRVRVRSQSRTAGGGITTADTDSRGRREMEQYLEPKLADGAKPVSNGGQRNVADTDNTLLERRNKSGCQKRGQRLHLWRHFAGHGDEEGEEGICGERWQNFPTVSPVHRGNDGLPFDVDSLAVHFSKWRTESIKAYGNAIVPQVMYEIFRAIELVSNQ